jgi:hypothetical protein
MVGDLEAEQDETPHYPQSELIGEHRRLDKP